MPTAAAARGFQVRKVRFHPVVWSILRTINQPDSSGTVRVVATWANWPRA